MRCPVCHKDNPPEAEFCEFCRLPLPDPSTRFQKTDLVSGTAVSDAEFEKGSLIANRYLVVRELGRGGMGVVYLVKDQKLRGKEVALKLISAELTASHQGQERFVQEVLAAQELTHPNVVKVFHLDEAEGQSFFTMEYIPGRSLREIIEERKATGCNFSVKECHAIILPVLEGLHHAHTQIPPVIHRDIKPDNIIVSGEISSPLVKVLDFGLAKMISSSRMKSTVLNMGTAYYMAPEQMMGAKDIDQRADLFSVGVMLYEMLTGEIPIGRFDLPSEVDASLPKAIDDLVNTALQQLPGKRFQSAREIVAALDALALDADEDEEWRSRQQRTSSNLKEAKVQAAEKAKKRAEYMARMNAEVEARRKAEDEAMRKVEEVRRKATEEARLQAVEEARRKAVEEAKRRQVEEKRREEDALRKAKEESSRRKIFFAVACVTFAVLAFFVWKGA